VTVTTRGIRALTFAAVVALTGCPPTKPAENAVTATVKDTELPNDVKGLLDYADAEYTKQTAVAMQNALKAIDKALTLAKTDYESLWRAARVYAWLGDKSEDDDRKEEYAQKGIDRAKEAVGADPGRVEGAYYLATTTGQYAYVKRIKAKDLVPQVLDAAKKAVAVDEKYDHAGPLRLLGSLYAQAPEPPTSVGDHEEGVKVLKKAVQLAGAYPQNHLLLGDALRINDQLDEAEAEYQRVLNAQPTGLWGHFLAKWQRQAEDGLKRVNNLRRQKTAGDRGSGGGF
jgi:tetratricopeptide (TPR) repeat protein